MKARHWLAAAALVVTPLAFAPPVDAKPPTEAADVRGGVKIDKNDASVATVHVKYVCPENDNVWLFVSAKQTEDAERHEELTQDGEWSTSEGNVNAWLQSHPLGEVVCDGTWQNQKFEINTEEQGWGELQKGYAWIQFCLIGGEGEPPDFFIYTYPWVKTH